MDRRQLLVGMGALAATPALGQDDIPRYSSPVIDMHFHMRDTPELSIAHQVGAGVAAANLLTTDGSGAVRAATMARNPAMFPCWFMASDFAKPEAEAHLTAAVKAGAKGFGEMKLALDADGPEMRRCYALAADLGVPVLLHFQDPLVNQPPAAGFNRGIRRFAAILQAFPRTKFIGHGNSFWANVSADNADKVTYPLGPVVPGGISDKLLSDYPNMYADMSATSCNTLLSRDAAFSTDFLKRHQDKLHFGSDCGCVDGRGGSAPGGRRAAAGPRPAPAPGEVTVIQGKCIARENLALLTRITTPDIFRRLVWTNAHARFGIPA